LLIEYIIFLLIWAHPCKVDLLLCIVVIGCRVGLCITSPFVRYGSTILLKAIGLQKELSISIPCVWELEFFGGELGFKI
jgi:hypothetical protein